MDKVYEQVKAIIAVKADEVMEQIEPQSVGSVMQGGTPISRSFNDLPDTVTIQNWSKPSAVSGGGHENLQEWRINLPSSATAFDANSQETKTRMR